MVHETANSSPTLGKGRLSFDDGGGQSGGGDGGYVVVLVGLLLLPLLLMTAFAVDVGAWYAQGSKMQRAVDQAALAGVVWMPNETMATGTAAAVLAFNGYAEEDFDTPDDVKVDYPTSWQMEVSVSRPGVRYFSSIVFSKDQVLKRSAIAAYNKPIPLGSPGKVLGNDVEDCFEFMSTQCAPDNPQPGYFLNAPGPYSQHSNADPFMGFCETVTPPYNEARCGTQDAPKNLAYRPEGHEFAIDVPESAVNTDITLEIWDAIQVRRRRPHITGPFASVAPDPPKPYPTFLPLQGTPEFPLDCQPFSPIDANLCQTGDYGPHDRNGLDVQFELFDNDGSDATVSYDTSICELFIPQGSPPGTGPTAADTQTVLDYKNVWAPVCTFTPTKAGIYPIRVKTSSITLTNNWGSLEPTSRMDGRLVIPTDYRYQNPNPATPSQQSQIHNAYSMKIDTTSAATLYALSDVPAWSNTPGSENWFYLANIGPQHHDKELVVDVFDLGDGAVASPPQDYELSVLAPPQSSPFNVPPLGGTPLLPPKYGTSIPSPNVVDTCKATTIGTLVQGAGALEPYAECKVVTQHLGLARYDNKWLRYSIKLSPNYTCSNDCWWVAKYTFGTGTPTDATTWMVSVVGDPVHLIR